MQKCRIAAECVSLLYRISIRTNGTKVDLEDSIEAATREWTALMEQTVPELESSLAELTKMLADCPPSWMERVERSMNRRGNR